MTIDTAKLRSLANGWRGRWFYDGERGDLAYIAKDCDDKQCDCERNLNADGDQDCSTSLGYLDGVDDCAEPIAEMLNAVPALLDEVERWRRAAEIASQDETVAREVLRAEHLECQRLRALVLEACDLARSYDGGVTRGRGGLTHGKRLAAIRSEVVK